MASRYITGEKRTKGPGKTTYGEFIEDPPPEGPGRREGAGLTGSPPCGGDDERNERAR
jgi:hypothetical protein